HCRCRVDEANTRLAIIDFLETDIAWQHEHRYTGPCDRRLNRDLNQSGNLVGMRDRLAEMTAVDEQPFGVRFLKVPAADLAARYVRGNRQNGDAAAIAVVQPVDQVDMSRTAAAGA